MRISEVETVKGLERRMTLAVPHAQVDSLVNSRLQETARTVALKGFRKGKVPVKVARERFGRDVRDKVLHQLMTEGWQKAVDQRGLRPAGSPVVEIREPPPPFSRRAEVEFIVAFEVYPEVELPDFAAIKVERLYADVKSGDIKEMVQILRQQRQTWRPVSRPVAAGDRIRFDCRAARPRPERDENEAAGDNAARDDTDTKTAAQTAAAPPDPEWITMPLPGIKRGNRAGLRDAELQLGSGNMPIAGFEEGVIGKAAGEDFILSVTAPPDYCEADLAGQPIDLHISLKLVVGPLLPEVDDEFYKGFGVDEGKKTFHQEVVANMERELKRAARKALRRQVEDALLKQVEFPIPGALVQAEIRLMRKLLLAQRGIITDDEAEMRRLLPDSKLEKLAWRVVCMRLIIDEVMRQQDIKPDPARLRAAVEEVAATYESPADVVDWYYDKENKTARNALARLEAEVTEERVFDHIIEQVKVKRRKVSYRKLIERSHADPQAAALAGIQPTPHANRKKAA